MYKQRIIHKQISSYINNFVSLYLCGYGKESVAQQAFLFIIKKWKNILDKKWDEGTVLMDLCEAFDMLNHNFLIAKLHAYGFARESLKLIKSY